jgi:hypothetical protein
MYVCMYVYTHTYLCRPENMLDDLTGEPLSQRADDTIEALGKRLEGYRELCNYMYVYACMYVCMYACRRHY